MGYNFLNFLKISYIVYRGVLHFNIYTMSEEDRDGPLDDIYQREVELEMVNTAYINSYRVLIGEITFDNLIHDSFKEGNTALMAFDPDNGPMLEELESMIEWYEDSEEYEKCMKLKNIMNIEFPETIF
jgi:hypothetical protein